MMRDFNMTYIPDLTERFPEGFNGVDLTPYRYDEYDAWDELARESEWARQKEIEESEKD